MTRRLLLPFALVLFLMQPFSWVKAQSNLNEHPESIQELAEYLEERGLEFQKLLGDSRFKYYDGISKRFTRSAEKKIESVDAYKRVIGYDGKMRAINDFISDYEQELELAEKEYGIPRFVIAAILGIESDFGKVKGSYNPFNVYVSMIAEDYRSDFAKAQLEELLEFTRRNKIDVFEMESSYAGAMSHAQFIPYSLNRWFVGTDLYDMKNNIASVANYLAHFYEITGTMEKAVMRYNPSSLYTKAVLSLADDAKTLHAERSEGM